MPVVEASQRLDKWLWFARVTKTRSLATRLVEDGRIRLNRERVTRPSRPVRTGDVITASIERRIRVLRVLALAIRRGPASEAAMLYDDISPPPPPSSRRAQGLMPAAARAPGAGRPTKRDRRRIDSLRRGESDHNT